MSSGRPGRAKIQLTLEQVAQYIHLPITTAANALGVCVALLKRKCRVLGLSRWPYRQVKALSTKLSLRNTKGGTKNLPQHLLKEIEALKRFRESALSTVPNTSIDGLVYRYIPPSESPPHLPRAEASPERLAFPSGSVSGNVGTAGGPAPAGLQALHFPWAMLPAGAIFAQPALFAPSMMPMFGPGSLVAPPQFSMQSGTAVGAGSVLSSSAASPPVHLAAHGAQSGASTAQVAATSTTAGAVATQSIDYLLGRFRAFEGVVRSRVPAPSVPLPAIPQAPHF